MHRVERINDILINKKIIYLKKDSTREEWNKGMNADVIISAPRYLEKPIGTKQTIKNNKLVIAIHTRGWHDGVDEAFDNIYADNLDQMRSWIRNSSLKFLMRYK